MAQFKSTIEKVRRKTSRSLGQTPASRLQIGRVRGTAEKQGAEMRPAGSETGKMLLRGRQSRKASKQVGGTAKAEAE